MALQVLGDSKSSMKNIGAAIKRKTIPNFGGILWPMLGIPWLSLWRLIRIPLNKRIGHREQINAADTFLGMLSPEKRGSFNYLLEIVENGSFDNRKGWKSLTVEVNYGGSMVDQNSDNSRLCFL